MLYNFRTEFDVFTKNNSDVQYHNTTESKRIGNSTTNNGDVIIKSLSSIYQQKKIQYLLIFRFWISLIVVVELIICDPHYVKISSIIKLSDTQITQTKQRQFKIVERQERTLNGTPQQN